MRQRSVRSLDAQPSLRNERRLKDETMRGGRGPRSERVVKSGEWSWEDGPGPHLVLAYAIRLTHLRLGKG